VEIDPIFHKLTTSHDMSNVNSLFLARLHTNGTGALILDSHAPSSFALSARRTDEDELPSSQNGTAFLTLPKECTSLFRKVMTGEHKVFDDKFFNDFTFNRNNANVAEEYRFLDDTDTNFFTRGSHFTFDLNAEPNYDDDQVPPDHFNLSQHGDDLGKGLDSDDDESNSSQAALHKSIMQAVNMESLPGLQMILEPGEYSYFKKLKDIFGSELAPDYWRKHARLRRQKLQDAVAAGDGEGPVLPGRKPKDAIFFDFITARDPECPDLASSKLKFQTLEKWSKDNDKLLRIDYVYFDTRSFLHPFHKETEFDFFETSVASAVGSARGTDAEGTERDEDMSSVASPPLPDDPDLDDDDFQEVFDSQPPLSQPFSLDPNTQPGETFTATQNTALVGDNLIEAPEGINQIVLPFARYAKRIDVKKLKRAIIDTIVEGPKESSFNENQENDFSSSVGVRFSEVFHDLPGKIPPKMVQEVTPPIGLVALLHLANEKNLILENLPPTTSQSTSSNLSDRSSATILDPSYLTRLTDIIIKTEPPSTGSSQQES